MRRQHSATDMGVRIIAALRDLDPPAGGAEMSLATLLKGVASQTWMVQVLQSGDRGATTDLTANSGLTRTTTSIPIESIWSGLAWRLRDKRTGKPHPWLQRQHLKSRNRAFAKWLAPHLEEARAAGDDLLGVTQLDWSAGAAAAFNAAGIPHLAFVRDELQFNHPDVYRDSLSKAAAVCGAGHGLLMQIQDVFKLRRAAHIPLPVDFEGRFGSPEEVAAQRQAGLARRDEAGDTSPRIAIVGVTPEKGLALYRRLLPQLAEAWPEARVDIYGGGAHVEALAEFPNVTCHGHTPVSEIFSTCDVHLLTVETTGSWGRVINEAGYYGVPSVSIEIGAQPEAVGPGGIIVPRDGGLEAWVEALQSCYRRRGELGDAAREHSSVIDHRRAVGMFDELIRSVLGLE